MRLPFLFIFAILFSAISTAQESTEFKVEFDKKCFLKSSAKSTSFDVAIPEEAAFTSLSAYILQPDVEVDLSFRLKQAGDWGEWRKLESHAEGETPGRSTFGPTVIEENFSKIEFRSSDSLDEQVIFRLFFPGSSEKKSPDQTGAVAADSSCNCVQPPICARSCWCPSNTCDKDPNPDSTSPTHIIIHHSAGGNNASDYGALVNAYWDFHVNTNGWSDIGYNWLIDPDGVVYEGRGDGVMGAHFSCMNSETTGICLIGNFENAVPTTAAISSLNYLIAWESCDKGIPPVGTSLHTSSQLLLPHISAHRDGNSATVPHGCPSGTVCPGENLYSMLPSIRTAVGNNPCLGYLHQEEDNAPSKAMIYPIPAKDRLHIKTRDKLLRAELINSNGQVVKTLSGNPEHFSVSDLAKGVYLLRLSFENHTQTDEVVIE